MKSNQVFQNPTHLEKKENLIQKTMDDKVALCIFTAVTNSFIARMSLSRMWGLQGHCSRTLVVDAEARISFANTVKESRTEHELPVQI